MIGVQELQQALVNGDWTPFDIDTVKLLMSMHDADRSGQLSFNEFVSLFGYVEQWQAIFRQSDRDGSGSIDESELGNALAKFGFGVSPQIVHLVVQKYKKTGSGNAASGISFDHFVRACVAIRSLTQGFQKYDPERRGAANITYQQFLELGTSFVSDCTRSCRSRLTLATTSAASSLRRIDNPPTSRIPRLKQLILTTVLCESICKYVVGMHARKLQPRLTPQVSCQARLW